MGKLLIFSNVNNKVLRVYFMMKTTNITETKVLRISVRNTPVQHVNIRAEWVNKKKKETKGHKQRES